MCRPFLLIVIVIVLICTAGCGTLGASESAPTVQAEVTALADEATLIAQASENDATQIAVTVAAAQTAAAFQEGVNRQLVVTLRAVVPPTMQVVADTGIVTPGMNAPLNSAPMADGMTPEPGAISASADGMNTLTQIGTTTVVNESDGCASGLQTSFTAATPRIYASTRALNIRGGTTVFVEWRYNDQVVASSLTYTVPADETDFCLWFYLEPTDAPFVAGNWSAQFYIDGSPVTPAASFTMN